MIDANISKYMAFLKVVEYGNFTKAAEVLEYSQSAISRMVSALENEWNITLLERSKSGISLTSDGLRVFPYIKNICMEYNKLQMEILDINNLQSGYIRIGTFSSVATHWLPVIIKKFREIYPGIDYELLLGDYTEIENWIHEGRVDCGFLSVTTMSDIETVFLKEDKFMAVMPKNHILSQLNKIPIAALCNEPFIILEKNNNAEICNIFKINNLEPMVRYKTWDDYSIMSMVENGLGVSILPDLILKRVPFDISIKELDVKTSRKIAFAYRRNRDSLILNRFKEHVLNMMRMFD